MAMPLDGIYAAYLSGQVGNGFALLQFRKGRIAGADSVGVTFDGNYVEDSDHTYQVMIEVKSPPNQQLIQGGTSGPMGYSYKLDFQLSKDFPSKDFTRIETPLGPVNARLSKLRSLDD